MSISLTSLTLIQHSGLQFAYLKIHRLQSGDVNGNGIPIGMGMKTTFPCEWNGNGNDFCGTGNFKKKYTVKKIPTAVRFQAQMNPLINSDDLRSDHVTDHG